MSSSIRLGTLIRLWLRIEIAIPSAFYGAGFFRLGLILAIGCASPSHTQAQSVVAGPGDSQKLPYVLVANNEMRARRVEERAIFAETSAASAEARAEIVKIKTRAPRKARG